MDEDEVLPDGYKMLAVLLWMAFAWVPSLTLWLVFGYFGFYYSPALWLLTAGVTAPGMCRIIGYVRTLEALPAATRQLPHLPAALARLVTEAAAIRADLGPRYLDSALERAWVLSCEFERLPQGLGMGLDSSRAALVAIRELIDLRAEPGTPRLSPPQLRDRLADALVQFETSLAEPVRVGFR